MLKTTGFGGIDAAKGPATVGGQGPGEMVVVHGLQQNSLQTLWRGALTACGMDAAIELPRTDSRRVP
ncbi:hypothetical protein FHY18_002998 [Xanthomonas arboricola]|nr:hypothetical protein [Xanthomonas sp. 3793]